MFKDIFNEFYYIYINKSQNIQIIPLKWRCLENKMINKTLCSQYMKIVELHGTISEVCDIYIERDK